MVERELAHRLFAKEFNDSCFQLQSVSSHSNLSQADAVHSPNFLVTPTGVKANRVFIVGVITESEDMGEQKAGEKELWRARISDPTGSFTIYAGNYQPEALVFLSNVEVPSYVMVVGKVRSYEPESGEVFVSIRPEEIHYADDALRNQWVVDTAELTLKRVDMVEKALDSGLTGKALMEYLKESDIPLHIAEGICLSLEYYHTNSSYIGKIKEDVKSSLLSIKDNLAPESAEEPDYESLLLEIMEYLGNGNVVEYSAILNEASSKGIPVNQVDHNVRLLLSKGHIYEPRAGMFKVIH